MSYVDLHLHLDGAVRLSTLFDLACSAFHNNHTIYDLDEAELDFTTFQSKIQVTSHDLEQFLKPFNIVNDLINYGVQQYGIWFFTRLVLELCEDMTNQHLMYFEVRYNPCIYVRDQITDQDIVNAVALGLNQGYAKYNIIAKQILCMFRNSSQDAMRIVDLAHANADTVVGIDLAGDEGPEIKDIIVCAFQRAKELNIHRTAHTENKRDFDVIVNVMCVDRIGHGYYICNDQDMMNYVKSKNIHMECSVTPGSYGNGYPEIKLQAAKIFQTNSMSFSLNTDDPTIKPNCSMESEFALFFGTSNDKGIIDITTNTIRNAFVDNDTKLILMNKLKNLNI